METIKNRERFESRCELTDEKLNKALKKVIRIIDNNIEFFEGRIPKSPSINGVYETETSDDSDWTQGFWPGMLWLLYEITGDEKYKNTAESFIDSFYNRIENRINTGHHDMGFLYSLSCVAAYKLTGNEKAKIAALKAADALIERFQEKGQLIQAWGPLNNSGSYRMIVDCLLNIPLLYWASNVTGDDKYENIAFSHFNTSAEYILREDGSTFHTFYFDMENGSPLYGKTVQGAADDSCWSRGQAWAVYGFILTYLYRKNDISIPRFKKAANYFLNRLPKDFISYWDLIFEDGDEERDSSAAAIAACGLLAGGNVLPSDDADKDIYINAAKQIVNSLIDSYMPEDEKEGTGLILHGVYTKPAGLGIDECMVWGDYFFLEALARLILKDKFIIFW